DQGRLVPRQPVGPVRYARQRLGMVCRPLQSDVLPRQSRAGPRRPGRGRAGSGARRELAQRHPGLSRRPAEGRPAGEPAQRYRFSGGARDGRPLNTQNLTRATGGRLNNRPTDGPAALAGPFGGFFFWSWGFFSDLGVRHSDFSGLRPRLTAAPVRPAQHTWQTDAPAEIPAARNSGGGGGVRFLPDLPAPVHAEPDNPLRRLRVAV